MMSGPRSGKLRGPLYFALCEAHAIAGPKRKPGMPMFIKVHDRQKIMEYDDLYLTRYTQWVYRAVVR